MVLQRIANVGEPRFSLIRDFVRGLVRFCQTKSLTLPLLLEKGKDPRPSGLAGSIPAVGVHDMKKQEKPEKFQEDLIKQILIHPKINRFEVKDRVLILDGIKFLLVGNENIKSNHKPIGLYIEATDILKYIEKNLFGHDKSKFGVTKQVKED